MNTKIDPRLPIIIGPDLSRVVDQTIEAMADRDVFQRQGVLVDVVRDATTDTKGIVRPDGTPRVRFLPQARLYELLTEVIDFKRRAKTETGEWVARSVQPPAEVVRSVVARGEWNHVRRLAGITTWPVLRADGSVLTSPGYDFATGLIYEPTCNVGVPVNPKIEDAKAAVADLLDLVSDFPFAGDAHRSAWLAALLTLLARAAIDGPTPLTLIDANERGSGKTLLADAIGMIVAGKTLPRRTACEDAAEWKKAMLAIAIAADPIILIDNVTKMLRSDALDAVLTGTEFRERVLGKNEELCLAVRTVFLATANNATLSADLVRRSLHVRIEAATERPEQRQGFKFDPLLAHIATHRARYLSAGLTILRAYFEAGRPKVDMRPMGSFEAWSSVVRGALIWAGQPDPAETQDGLREGSDPERESLGALLESWHAVYGDRPVTAKDVLGNLEDPEKTPEEHTLNDAIAVFCDADYGRAPSLRRFANRLRAARGRIAGGVLLELAKKEKNLSYWRTRVV